MMTDDPTMTLAQARALLREQVEDGATCPCCTQYAKVYRRKITSLIARTLIAMHNAAGDDWVHVPSLVGHQGGDGAKARYWGLTEEAEGTRDDGSHRVGWWRLTPLGTAFVLGQARVPKYVRTYDGRLLSVVDGERIDIFDALGNRFDYRELMQS